jgi:hypothetical protein
VELLNYAAIWGREKTLEYLLDMGVNPNDKANGGSSVLDSVLLHFNVVRFDV